MTTTEISIRIPRDFLQSQSRAAGFESALNDNDVRVLLLLLDRRWYMVMAQDVAQ